MARFSANITDSSEDEDEVHTNPPKPSSRKPADRPRPAPAPSIEDDDEDNNEKEELSDSDSSEMQEDELIASPPSRAKRPTQTRNALVEDEDGEIRYAHELRTPPKKSPAPPPRQRNNPTIIPWAQQIGVDAQKMHVMQASLFRMPEEAAAMKAAAAAAATTNNPTLSKPPTKSRLQLPKHMSRKHSRDSDGDGPRMESREVCYVFFVSSRLPF